MKKFLMFAFWALPLSLHAQSEETMPGVVAAAETTVNTAETTAPVYGYLSYSKMLQAMPDYALAHKQYLQIEEKYAAEAKSESSEFNAKSTSFSFTEIIFTMILSFRKFSFALSIPKCFLIR